MRAPIAQSLQALVPVSGIGFSGRWMVPVQDMTALARYRRRRRRRWWWWWRWWPRRRRRRGYF